MIFSSCPDLGISYEVEGYEAGEEAVEPARCSRSRLSRLLEAIPERKQANDAHNGFT